MSQKETIEHIRTMSELFDEDQRQLFSAMVLGDGERVAPSDCPFKAQSWLNNASRDALTWHGRVMVQIQNKDGHRNCDRAAQVNRAMNIIIEWCDRSHNLVHSIVANHASKVDELKVELAMARRRIETLEMMVHADPTNVVPAEGEPN